MKSIRELYTIGRGPSSSHTIGPERAAKVLKERYPLADHFRIILYGSLAKTGQGHLTDQVLRETLAPVPVEIIFDETSRELLHPNAMDMIALRRGGEEGRLRVYSVGGGAIEIEGSAEQETLTVYPLSSFASIAAYCRERRWRLYQYVAAQETPAIWDFLAEIWQAMQAAIARGLQRDGVLNGGIGTERRAKGLYQYPNDHESMPAREHRLVSAYAFAVSEENASLGQVVTAPTCGASGVLPAVLRYGREQWGYSDEQIKQALATAGLIGNLIKTNASISGAECGCQAEIGSACCMAAAALAELAGLTIDQIEYAAEVAMEHHLGLSCDPVGGLVQIPCIERNAVAALRAIDAMRLASFPHQGHKISFDLVIKTMLATGRDLAAGYRETAEGGLAQQYAREGKRAEL